jgi:Bacterial protein of unknown function (DUF839)
MRRVQVLLGAVVVALAVVPAHGQRIVGVEGSVKGYSSSETPYVVPTSPGWKVVSLLTVGDSPSEAPYPMVGIPDGLGALAGRVEAGKYVSDRQYMTVFMNHELGNTVGAVRAHGQPGAFVSQWTVELNTLRVVRGQDLTEQMFLWSGGQHVRSTGPLASIGRLCSGDLPALGAFFNPSNNVGFNGRIFMSGEESGNEGRAFAHILSGSEKGRSYELPYLGKFSWENAVAHPAAGDRTIVVGLDDSTPGQVYVYLGTKQLAGSPVEQAGLLGGTLYGVRVTNGGTGYGSGPVALENAGAIRGNFVLQSLPGAVTMSGATLQTVSVSAGVTEFARPEDGSWDTRNPNVFYFVTTGATIGGAAQTSRLYKLTFDNLANPAGGSIELVLDAVSLVGTDGARAQTFDNITVDGDGAILIQEDPGNAAYIAKTWRVDPAAPLSAVQILESDRTRFVQGAPKFLTQDEENSGIIDVTEIVKPALWYEAGRRYYLADMQAHYANGTTLVEGGQLYLLVSPKR